MDTYSETEYSSSDFEEEYDLCCRNEKAGCGTERNGSGTCRSGTCGSGPPYAYGMAILPFDPTSLENVILTLSDKFNFRVLLSDSRAKKAILVTTGMTLAGTLIGKHYGGKVGAAVGGAVGGACGLGIAVVSMREIWKDVQGKLAQLFDIVYDYLSGLGIADYKKAVEFLMQNSGNATQLAMVILHVASDILGKQILSTLTT